MWQESLTKLEAYINRLPSKGKGQARDIMFFTVENKILLMIHFFI